MTSASRTARAAASRGSGRAAVRFLATALPGLGVLLAEELVAELADRAEVERIGGQFGGDVDKTVGHDGRNDLVGFTASGGTQLLPRIAEDVFVEIGSTKRRADPRRVAELLIESNRLDRGLSVLTTQGRHPRAAESVHVVTRVLSEDDFLRTELRHALEQRLVAVRPRWSIADPGALEVWVVEVADGFVAGLRLTDSSQRHRHRRARERTGSLRASVAAAMVRLAGDAERICDPCCGSGTILAEALALDREVTGSDSDPDAVTAARANLPEGIDIRMADARALPHLDSSINAVVSNLPFGSKFPIDNPVQWYTDVLAEFARITAPYGRVVILAPARPAFTRALQQTTSLRLDRRVDINLLGAGVSIWVLRREA